MEDKANNYKESVTKATSDDLISTTKFLHDMIVRLKNENKNLEKELARMKERKIEWEKTYLETMRKLENLEATIRHLNTIKAKLNHLLTIKKVGRTTMVLATMENRALFKILLKQ